jgi:hypothetical protein
MHWVGQAMPAPPFVLLQKSIEIPVQITGKVGTIEEERVQAW